MSELFPCWSPSHVRRLQALVPDLARYKPQANSCETPSRTSPTVEHSSCCCCLFARVSFFRFCGFQAPVPRPHWRISGSVAPIRTRCGNLSRFEGVSERAKKQGHAHFSVAGIETTTLVGCGFWLADWTTSRASDLQSARALHPDAHAADSRCLCVFMP